MLSIYGEKKLLLLLYAIFLKNENLFYAYLKFIEKSKKSNIKFITQDDRLPGRLNV